MFIARKVREGVIIFHWPSEYLIIYYRYLPLTTLEIFFVLTALTIGQWPLPKRMKNDSRETEEILA